MEEDSTDHGRRHHQEEDAEEYGSKGTSSTNRSYYGCSFCKQGFTNAQALGGHMNIHRKHRVIKKKTKQGQAVMPMMTAAKSSMNKEFNNADEFLRYYSSIFQNINPKWSQSLNKQEFDLNLQIGSARDVDVNGDRSMNLEEDSEEVDLELRLGHHISIIRT